MTTARLPSLGESFNAVVIGATGGIGGAFVDALAADPGCARLFALARRPARSASTGARSNVVSLDVDIEDEASIAAAAAEVSAASEGLHLVIVATGILHDDDTLHPEKSWRHVDPAALERVFRVNAIGPALIAKHFLPLLADDRKAVFAALGARVGSISDNRLGGWHAYCASKAALHMLVRTDAIELARRKPDALCVALHPGTVVTRLSAPFRANVPPNTLVPAKNAAARLLGVLDGLEASDSGYLFDWDGSRVPF